MTFPPMRSQDEIQRAHDLLVHLLLDDLLPGHPSMEFAMRYAEALCWVLHHDHNPMFERHLKAIEDALAEAGCILYRVEEPEL